MKNTITNWADKLSEAAGYTSAIFMILIVILINTEIIVRSFFDSSTYIADEYSSYFLVAVVLLGLAYALKEEAHIRVEVIRGRLPEQGKRLFDICGTLAGLVLTLFITYHSIQMVWDSYSLEVTADSISETPLYLPQLMIPIGLLLFALQLIATLIRRLR